MVESIRIYLDAGRLFYTLTAAVVAANLIFYAAVNRPQRDKVEDLEGEYFTLREERTRLRGELKEKHEYSRTVEELRREIDGFVGGLPPVESITDIIREIHGTAKRAGLTIRSAKYSPAKGKEEELLRFTISLPLTGNYRNIRRFIYDLERMPYLMSIDDLNLSSSRGGSVSLSLNLSVYFRKG